MWNYLKLGFSKGWVNLLKIHFCSIIRVPKSIYNCQILLLAHVDLSVCPRHMWAGSATKVSPHFSQKYRAHLDSIPVLIINLIGTLLGQTHLRLRRRQDEAAADPRDVRAGAPLGRGDGVWAALLHQEWHEGAHHALHPDDHGQDRDDPQPHGAKGMTFGLLLELDLRSSPIRPSQSKPALPADETPCGTYRSCPAGVT